MRGQKNERARTRRAIARVVKQIKKQDKRERDMKRGKL